MVFRILDFYRLSDLGCPDFVGTTGLAVYHHFMLATGWERNFNLLVWI